MSATADPGNSLTFDAIAAAYGVDVTASNSSLPFGLVVEGAGPVAQSHLSSLNQSDGFAAFPYPGEAANNLPALLKGTMLPGFPLPDNPFYVNASLGTPNADASFPGVELRARSQSLSSHARAVAGAPAVGYVATSDVTQTDEGVTATASTSVNLLSLGNLFTLSGIESTASAVLGNDGKVTTSTSVSIGRIIVPGLNITLPTSSPADPAVPVPIPGLPSFHLPFPSVPLPLGGTTLVAPDIGFEDGVFTVTLPLFGNKKFALPTKAVFTALKAVGLDLSVQQPIVTPNGVVAPALSISKTLPAPPENKYFNGPIPVTITLGRTTATFGSATATPTVPTVPGLGSGTGPVSMPPVGSGGNAVPVSSGDTSAPLPAPDQNLPVPPASATPQPQPPTRLQTLASERKLFSSLVPMYIAVVGIGVVGLFAGQFLRYLGVRSSWKS